MKKYTNKILIITLIVMAFVVVVTGTVEVRKAYRSGKIRTTKELINVRIDEDIMDADTVEVVNIRAEME